MIRLNDGADKKWVLLLKDAWHYKWIPSHLFTSEKSALRLGVLLKREGRCVDFKAYRLRDIFDSITGRINLC